MSSARLSYAAMGFRTFPVAFLATGPVIAISESGRVFRDMTETERDMYLDWCDAIDEETVDASFRVDVPINIEIHNDRLHGRATH